MFLAEGTASVEVEVYLVFGESKRAVDGAEFVMGKVRGDKVRDKGKLICVGFTGIRQEGPGGFLSSRVTKCKIYILKE